jgi:hypothetical protein
VYVHAVIRSCSSDVHHSLQLCNAAVGIQTLEYDGRVAVLLCVVTGVLACTRAVDMGAVPLFVGAVQSFSSLQSLQQGEGELD